jgi:hypothetical protein
MTPSLRDVCCARLPPERLSALAPLRAHSGVEVTLTDGGAWVRWPAGDEEVLRRVLPVAGVELYALRDGRWHRHGRHLPSFDAAPSGVARPLDRVLLPAAVEPILPPPVAIRPVPVTLAPDARPRRTTALVCGLAELAAWADTTSTARLGALRAARRGARVLLLGDRLPLLTGDERFWGEQVFAPLGWRPEPDLPEGAIREALSVVADEVVLLKATEVEAISRAAFAPLMRAGLRLALREVGA